MTVLALLLAVLLVAVNALFVAVFGIRLEARVA